jgi:excisionase family DNA binding protein
MFGVGPKTVSQWARDGKLPAITTPGGIRRFREADVQALLAASQEKHGN